MSIRLPMRFHWAIVFALCLAAPSSGQPPQPQPGGDIVFKSDVSQVRVDVRVLDRDNRAVPSLTVSDFILYEESRQRPIRGFATEEMPLDVLFLFDVSASMQPHVRRIVEAARDALNVLGEGDRVAIMVFDRATRLRTPFRLRDQVHGDFQNVIRQESFHGGTDITRGLIDAARYVQKNARKDARRAIIIVTDDQTERDSDEPRVLAALSAADAVLSALIAPDAMGYRSGYPGGGGYPRGGSRRGGGYPGGGIPDIIFGRRNPPGGGYPGGGYPGGNSRTRPAGSPEIARESGGDSLAVDDASALETTLQGLRKRYSLYFSMPPGGTPGAERSVRVELATSARRRFPEAEIRCRPTYRIPSDFTLSQEPETEVISQAPATETKSDTAPVAAPAAAPAPRLARRPAGETYNSHGPILIPGDTTSDSPPSPPAPAAAPASTGWRRIDGAAPAPAAPAKPETAPAKPDTVPAKPETAQIPEKK